MLGPASEQKGVLLSHRRRVPCLGAHRAARARPSRHGSCDDSNSANPQLLVHNSKAESDFIKFKKDVKSDLEALHTLPTKLEALITRKRKPDDRPKDTQGKAHAGLAQGKNHKAQKGAAATTVTQLMPAYYMNFSA